MTAHGAFHWNELMTRDPEAAKRFYGTTIGWTFEDMPMSGGTYIVASMDGRPVGGMLNTSEHAGMENIPESWFSYLSVDDVDARCKQAETAGATIARGPFDVPGVGRIAIIRQPGGGMVGWMTPTS